MNDYKDLVKRLRMFCLPCHGEEKSIGQSAADVIEHLQSKCERLVSDYEILAKMYAKANEDLCVRTKERDAAVADLTVFDKCKICKHYDENSANYGYTEFCENCGSYPWADDEEPNKWQWRGVREDNDEID